MTCVIEIHFLITTQRMRATVLPGTARRYKMVYADSSSSFSGIFLVDNGGKKLKYVVGTVSSRLKGKENSFSSGYFIAQSRYSCNLTLQIKFSISR
jgi:hypothetical protein